MRTLLGIAALAGMLAGLTAPAFAQAPATPPDKMAVPNSGTQIKCNPNGTGTATNGPNAETTVTSNVGGTPVTNVNPNGSGTTSTQTPTLAKPVKPDVQCAKTQQNAAPAAPMNTGTGSPRSAPMMNALSNNPNGTNWLDKYNRPAVAATHKTKVRHAKRATGGGS